MLGCFFLFFGLGFWGFFAPRKASSCVLLFPSLPPGVCAHLSRIKMRSEIATGAEEPATRIRGDDASPLKAPWPEGGRPAGGETLLWLVTEPRVAGFRPGPRMGHGCGGWSPVPAAGEGGPLGSASEGCLVTGPGGHPCRCPCSSQTQGCI